LSCSMPTSTLCIGRMRTVVQPLWRSATCGHARQVSESAMAMISSTVAGLRSSKRPGERRRRVATFALCAAERSPRLRRGYELG
jgi:hypothetical protein